MLCAVCPTHFTVFGLFTLQVSQAHLVYPSTSYSGTLLWNPELTTLELDFRQSTHACCILFSIPTFSCN